MNCDKIIKLLNLTQSSNDNEALLAIRKANKFILSNNKSWKDYIFDQNNNEDDYHSEVNESEDIYAWFCRNTAYNNFNLKFDGSRYGLNENQSSLIMDLLLFWKENNFLSEKQLKVLNSMKKRIINYKRRKNEYYEE